MVVYLLCGALLSGSLFAQFVSTQPVIGTAGYSASVPLSVAPGQIVTLFLPGMGNAVPGPVKAPSGKLPALLAGVSGIFRQTSDQPLPILEVQPIVSCTALPPGNCGSILAVTVQIPFDIVTFCPLCLRPIALIPAQIAISVNGVAGQFVDVTALADQVHFLTQCDVIMPGSSSLRSSAGLPCAPMVTHGDGKPVSATNPAKGGEELVAYATGLGQTNPGLIAGQPATAATPTQTVFALDFNYRPNALATKPATTPLSIAPVFSGATPGFVGLYQVNFIVPPAPAGLASCVDTTTIVPYANVVQSNLTVSLGSIFSFDGVGICVQPGS